MEDYFLCVKDFFKIFTPSDAKLSVSTLSMTIKKSFMAQFYCFFGKNFTQ